MERLTKKCWRNLDPWECCGQDNYCKRGCHDKGGCLNGCIVPKLYVQLAEYEDLEEHGLLLRLPCKVGDTVYVKLANYCEKEYAEATVKDFTHFISCGFCVVVTSEHFDKQNIPFTEFGKTVFLTQSEAEEKLRELEKQNG